MTSNDFLILDVEPHVKCNNDFGPQFGTRFEVLGTSPNPQRDSRNGSRKFCFLTLSFCFLQFNTLETYWTITSIEIVWKPYQFQSYIANPNGLLDNTHQYMVCFPLRATLWIGSQKVRYTRSVIVRLSKLERAKLRPSQAAIKVLAWDSARAREYYQSWAILASLVC
jgi:hypothetical protein